MQLSELRQKVLDLIAEKATDKGLVDATAGQNLDRFLNSANLRIWRVASGRQPQLFRVRGAAVTFVAATGYLDPTAYTGSGATQVKSIDLVEVQQGSVWYPVTPYDEPNQRFDVLEPIGPAPIPAGVLPMRWYQEQERIYFTPPPSANLQARATYVPLPVAMVADADLPLSGKLDEYHDLVALEAACNILRRDEHLRTPYDAERDRMLSDMVTDLARSQGQRTRRVRTTGPY